MQLRQRPAVVGADVEREAVDADGLGVIDLLGPLRGGLGGCEADHVVGEYLTSHDDITMGGRLDGYNEGMYKWRGDEG